PLFPRSASRGLGDLLQDRAMLRYLFSLILLALPSLSHAQLAHTWMAGVAKVKITPEKLMWMSGYGARDKPAEGKLTELWAKALALQNVEGQRCLLITMDLVGIDRALSQAVCAALQKSHGLSRDEIILSVSHTHCGPVVGGNLRPMYDLDETQQKYAAEYAETLKKKLLQVADVALGQSRLVTLSHGMGQATFAVNRRENVEKDVPKLRGAGKLRGPVDHDVPVLVARDEENKVVAVIFGYACHATVLSFYQWCGDYPGFAQAELEKAYPGAIAMFWAGCGADQNPLPRRTVDLAREYGQTLAESVKRVIGGPMEKIAHRIERGYEEVAPPSAELPSRDKLARDTLSKNKATANRAKVLLRQLEKEGSLRGSYPYPVQLWRLGWDIEWVVLGGEVVVDYSLRLRRFSDIRPQVREHTWVMRYANDVMAYIPSQRVLREGGYEGGGAMVYYGLPTVWSPRIEDLIIERVHRLRGLIFQLPETYALEKWTTLCAVSLNGKKREAILYDRLKSHRIWLSDDPKSDHHKFEVSSSEHDEKPAPWTGRVLRIVPTAIFFEKGSGVYRLSVGRQTIAEALAAPLSKKLVDELGLRGSSSTEPTVQLPTDRIAFRMKHVRWDWALDWLAEVTALDCKSAVKPPTGTFSFDPPIGKELKTYTKDEIIQIFQKALEGEGYALIRQDNALVLLPRDEFLPILDRGKLLRIEGKEIYFQVGPQAYVMRAGETFAEALLRPLTKERVGELGLKLAPAPK